MGANSKSIGRAGAATLLLAIASAITLASCMDGGQKYSFRVRRWNARKGTCDTQKWRVLAEDQNDPGYTEKPREMLQQLKALAEETSATTGQEEFNRRFYAERLVSFCELDEQNVCGDIQVSEMSQFLSDWGDAKFKRYINFARFCARRKLARCARKIMNDFDQRPSQRLENFLKSLAAAIGAEGAPLPSWQMYENVKQVNLREEWFKSPDNLVSDFRNTLDSLKTWFQNDVNIVDLAKDFGAVTEEELTAKFLLIKEYFRLADQIESWDAYNLIKANFRQQIERKYSFTIDEDENGGHEITVWQERSDFSAEQWLPGGNDYSVNPQLMLQQLKAQLGQIDTREDEGFLHVYYIRRLVSYSELKSKDIQERLNVPEFLEFISLSGQHKRYADFVKHYARPEIAHCAIKIISDLDRIPRPIVELLLSKLSHFFSAALGIQGDPLSGANLYKNIRQTNLAQVEFDVPAMLELLRKRGRGITSESSSSVDMRWKRVVRNLESTLSKLRSLVVREVNIVNLALGIGAIRRGQLTPKFRLINEYVNFAFQMQDLDA